jgi:hypothetical protein
MVSKKLFNEKLATYYLSPFLHSTLCGENLKGVGPQPLELPPVRYACCTKVLGFPPNLLPLLDELDVCALSQEPFLAAIEQFPPGMHKSLQVEAPFPVVVEPRAKNLPPLKADFGVAIFAQIQPNIYFP